MVWWKKKKNCWYVSYNKESSQNDLNLNTQKTLNYKKKSNKCKRKLNQDGISAFVSIWSHAPIILNILGVFQIYAAKLSTIRHILSGIIPNNPHEYPMRVLQKSRKTHNMTTIDPALYATILMKKRIISYKIISYRFF